jgi:hypothetical protein
VNVYSLQPFLVLGNKLQGGELGILRSHRGRLYVNFREFTFFKLVNNLVRRWHHRDIWLPDKEPGGDEDTLERIPALEPPVSPETPSGAASNTRAPPEPETPAEVRPWWRRLFRG